MDRIEQLLSDLRVEVAESRTHLEHISDHLARLNGRTQKTEDRIAALEAQATEARGAWKAAAGIASAVGAGLSWLLGHVGTK